MCCGIGQDEKERYAWIAVVPAISLLAVIIVACSQKLFHANPHVSFLAHAAQYRQAAANGQIPAPATDLAQMQQIVINNYVNSSLAIAFLAVVVFIVIYGLKVAFKARKIAWPTAKEAPAVYREKTATQKIS